MMVRGPLLAARRRWRSQQQAHDVYLHAFRAFLL
jgi:hypothetical protein